MLLVEPAGYRRRRRSGGGSQSRRSSRYQSFRRLSSRGNQVHLERLFYKLGEKVQGRGGNSTRIKLVCFQMWGLIIPGEWEGNQSLKPLIFIQGVKHYQRVSEDLTRISGQSSKDKVQDLGSNFLRKNSNFMVKLSLAYWDALDHKLGISLFKPNLCIVRAEGG